MYNIVCLEIRSLFVCGIYNITNVFPRKISKYEYGIPLKPHIKHSITSDYEWMIETQGTNLNELFKLPFIDTFRTYSNDFMEIYSFFGIEGARTFLLFEFTNIVTASGGYINPRHIKILVDKMTHTGEIRAIARYGIETAQYDPISRASFEEVMKHLITSASFSEVDRLNSISSNIALGTKIRAGTGYAQTKDIPIIIKSKPKIII
jgi:DNA-directed RNA polymerase beta' subunit